MSDHRIVGSLPAIRILLIGADPDSAAQLRETIKSTGGDFASLSSVRELEDGIARVRGEAPDVVLLDVVERPTDALEAVASVRSEAPDVPLIVMGDDDPSLAEQVVRLGARDFLSARDPDPRALVRSLQHALERRRLVAELHTARERAHYIATHDKLTGLPNRFSFQEQLRRSVLQAEREGAQVILLFLDLDRFKYVNDTLSHSVGDELLQAIARRLSASIRGCDLLARLGGDEFVVLVHGLGRDLGAIRIAQQLLGRLESPFHVAGRDLWVSASIGIAVSPRDGADPDTLSRNADAAMYQAKAEGGNRFKFYSESMNRAARKMLTLESRLRHAFDSDGLELHYQPRVDAFTGRILGCEALLRWTDPDLGRVPPDEFIPVAEETGLIGSIGEWVLEKACDDFRSWRAAGFDPGRISVNLSPHQLRDDAIRESALRSLWNSGLDPSQLEFEVTEGALMQSGSIAALQELVRIGIAVSLDDFGTGFSSLAYLKKIPVGIVKIDQSFIRNLVSDPDDTAIVGAILSIAEKLDLRVVAEGVETVAQGRILREQGCREMQGWIFSPAVPGDAFLELLRRGPMRATRGASR